MKNIKIGDFIIWDNNTRRVGLVLNNNTVFWFDLQDYSTELKENVYIELLEDIK